MDRSRITWSLRNKGAPVKGARQLDKAPSFPENGPMSSKKIWFSTAVFAFALLFFALFSPAVFAQSKDDKDRSSDRYQQLFQYVYTFIQKNYVDEVDPKVLYAGAMKGMLDSLKDPYTTYIETDSLMGTSLKDTTTGVFGGVGLSITKATESTPDKPAWVEVASPIEDTPGWKAGVQPGDLIISIDGTDTADISMENVLSRLRGPVGTNVTIVLRRGKLMEFPVTLTRALIEYPTVKYSMMENGTGYLRIIEVYSADLRPGQGGARLVRQGRLHLPPDRPAQQSRRAHHERRRCRGPVSR